MLNAAVGAVLAVPLVVCLLGPALKKGSNTGSWIALGGIDDFPVGETRLAEFRSPVANFDDGDTARSPAGCAHLTQQFQVFAIPTARTWDARCGGSRSRTVPVPLSRRCILRRWEPGIGPSGAGLFEYKYRIDGNSLVIHAETCRR